MSPWNHLHLKENICHEKQTQGQKLTVMVLFLSTCMRVCVCVFLTSSVCSMSTGEYGGGPSIPHGASCKMSGAGRQI